MNIIILGAGLIGVSSAYYLNKVGHNVTVIDRQEKSGQETSFANGGQISVCYSEPWSSISNLKKIIGWLGKEDSPILFRPQLDIAQMQWGMRFLKECLPANNKSNIQKMLKIALYSRQSLQELRAVENLQYEQQTNGILTFYTSKDSFEQGKEAAKFMSAFGCDRYIKTTEETLSIEQSLKNCTLPIYGSDFTPDDESGNALIYTEQLTQICKQNGVQFLFNHDIKKFNLNLDGDTITSVVTENNDKSFVLQADKFVLAAGSYSSLLAKSIGVYLPIYPAKGYSATLDITDPDLINYVSLTDMDNKTVYTRLGNKLRIAGTAEFNGYNLDLNEQRCKSLVDRVRKILPNGLDYDNPFFWTGLRPATPGNVPIIQKFKNNLYVNSGHGTLGWTMATGSGKLISQIINNKPLFGNEF